jgi:hypothetical protein
LHRQAARLVRPRDRLRCWRRTPSSCQVKGARLGLSLRYDHKGPDFSGYLVLAVTAGYCRSCVLCCRNKLVRTAGLDLASKGFPGNKQELDAEVRAYDPARFSSRYSRCENQRARAHP